MTAELGDRIERARATAAHLEHQKKVRDRRDRDEKRKAENHCNFLLGMLVRKHFPNEAAAVRVHRGKGAAARNAAEIEWFDCFLSVLASDKALMATLKDEVKRRLPADEFGVF